jgi:cytochrome c oxidase cbb3-type subunit 1
MVAQFTSGERQLSLIVLLLIAITGLAMAVAGRADPLGVHGFIVLAASAALIFVVAAAFYAPEPSPERLDHYYDDPSKVGIVLTMAWAVVGLLLGVWVAVLLAWPDLTFDAAWASFGRLRPAHTSAVIFGFGGNALIATSFHVLHQKRRF